MFVLNTKESGGSIEELYSVLNHLCSHKKFKLAILDFEDTVHNCPNDVYLLQLTKPIKKFETNWNKNTYRRTKLAKYIEQNICYFVKNILNREFS